MHSRFVSHGDQHNSKYDYLGIGTKIYVGTTTAKDEVFSTSGITADEGCHYSIQVYPSEDFEDMFRTNDPVI